MQSESMEVETAASGSQRWHGAPILFLALSLLGTVTGCGGAESTGGEVGAVADANDRLTYSPSVLPSALVTLVSGVTPSSIALSATDVYFIDDVDFHNEVDRVPIAGGPEAHLAHIPISHLTSLVRSGNTLFWAQVGGRPDDGVWELPLQGGTPLQISQHPQDLISNQALATYVTEDNFITPIRLTTTHVLFANSENAKLFDTRLSIFGTAEVSLLAELDPMSGKNYYPFSIVIDANNVYFTHDGSEGLWRAPLSGGATTRLVSNVARQVLAIDGSQLFFQQGNNINQIAVTGGPVSTFAANVGTVSALTARSGVVYWACGSCGTVVKQAVGSSTRTTLASSQDNPMSLAVDDNYVYFGTNSALKSTLR